MFVASHPSINLYSYVDDDTVLAIGSQSEILKNVPAAAAALHGVFLRELHCGLADDKLLTFGSNLGLAKKLSAALGKLGGVPCVSSVSLGWTCVLGAEG